MRVYLDASALVAWLIEDPFSERMDKYLEAETPNLVISDFAEAEFCSAVARQARMGSLAHDAARKAFHALDGLTPRAAERVEMSPADIKGAETFIRRLDLTLRTPDAIHIAIAQRIGALLLTFDEKMISASKTLGIPVVPA